MFIQGILKASTANQAQSDDLMLPEIPFFIQYSFLKLHSIPQYLLWCLSFISMLGTGDPNKYHLPDEWNANS